MTLDERIEKLCGWDAIDARREAWLLLRERLKGDDEAQLALTYLLGDLGEALAFVSIEGARLSEMIA